MNIVAATLPGCRRVGTDGNRDNLQVSHAITARKSGMRFDPDGEDFVVGHTLKAKSNLDHREDSDNLVAHSLRADGFDASEDGTGRGTPIVPILEVGGGTSSRGAGPNGCGIGREGDPMFTLQAGKQHAVGVRRLTPVECARLQGFLDRWTCLCDKEPCVCPDGPQYKAYGNAVTVNVIEWLGKRLIVTGGEREAPPYGLDT